MENEEKEIKIDQELDDEQLVDVSGGRHRSGWRDLKHKEEQQPPTYIGGLSIKPQKP